MQEKRKAMSLTCGRKYVFCSMPQMNNLFRVVIFVLVAWTRAHYTRFGLYFISRVESRVLFNRFLFAHSSHYWYCPFFSLKKIFLFFFRFFFARDTSRFDSYFYTFMVVFWLVVDFYCPVPFYSSKFSDKRVMMLLTVAWKMF